MYEYECGTCGAVKNWKAFIPRDNANFKYKCRDCHREALKQEYDVRPVHLGERRKAEKPEDKEKRWQDFLAQLMQ